MDRQEVVGEARWYVIHTYSGYENKVKANIEKLVENRSMQDQIIEISVPTQDIEEIRNGVKKSTSKKILPGYVLVFMHMNDDTWYIVRNTRGVTAFVGPGSKPVPLTEEEMKFMGIINESDININFSIGEAVRIKIGPFEGGIGNITEINKSRKMVTVSLTLFGRETPVEIDYLQIEKV